METSQPTLSTTGSEDNPIAWFRLVFLTENGDQNIRSYRDFAEDTIKERIERIAGVGEVNIGGRYEEMQIEIDPFRMAQHGLTVSAIVNKLRQANLPIPPATSPRANVATSFRRITLSKQRHKYWKRSCYHGKIP